MPSDLSSRDTCINCDQPIPQEKQRRHARYCCRACSQEYNLRKYHATAPRWGLPTPVIAAMSELVCATDLMRLGWDVYRAVAWTASCDIVAIKGNTVLRVEVRTAAVLKDDKLTSAKNGRYDVLARVWYDEVEYAPPLEELEVRQIA